MRRIALVVATLSAWCVTAATLPFGGYGYGPPRKTDPAIVALRDYTATLQTNLGNVTLKLLPDAAPNAVRTFIKLAERGAYDRTQFYGIFKGRMILAGDPAGKGETIKYEDSPLSPIAGMVALDRAPDGSNRTGCFFIVLSEQAHLDGDYTIFAEIAEGMEVARRIGSVATRPNDGCPAPVEDAVIEQVTVSKKKASDPKETKK